MKKWIVSILVILLLSGMHFSNPWFLDMVRMKALDQHQRNQEIQSLSNLVTVEINNETLKKKGSKDDKCSISCREEKNFKKEEE